MTVFEHNNIGDRMEFLKTVALALASLLALFVLTKIMGNKQMSQLTMFDYIIGISIGSIAAEMATEHENAVHSLVGMAIYALTSVIISYATTKWVACRRVIFGKSSIIMSGGVLYRKNMKKTHLDLNEFLTQCRSQGYFDLSDIDVAVLEPNGKLSILPFSEKRPVTAEDLKILPSVDSVCFNVIMDGDIMHRNLRAAGRDERWLKAELKLQNKTNIKEIFLATVDREGSLKVFESSEENAKNDIFE